MTTTNAPPINPAAFARVTEQAMNLALVAWAQIVLGLATRPEIEALVAGGGTPAAQRVRNALIRMRGGQRLDGHPTRIGTKDVMHLDRTQTAFVALAAA